MFQLHSGEELPEALQGGEEETEASQCQVQAGTRHQGEDEGRGQFDGNIFRKKKLSSPISFILAQILGLFLFKVPIGSSFVLLEWNFVLF